MFNTFKTKEKHHFMKKEKRKKLKLRGNSIMKFNNKSRVKVLMKSVVIITIKITRFICKVNSIVTVILHNKMLEVIKTIKAILYFQAFQALSFRE
jgi:hypothetical protein